MPDGCFNLSLARPTLRCSGNSLPPIPLEKVDPDAPAVLSRGSFKVDRNQSVRHCMLIGLSVMLGSAWIENGDVVGC
jgi:hypothetical protein